MLKNQKIYQQYNYISILFTSYTYSANCQVNGININGLNINIVQEIFIQHIYGKLFRYYPIFFFLQ